MSLNSTHWIFKFLNFKRDLGSKENVSLSPEFAFQHMHNAAGDSPLRRIHDRNKSSGRSGEGWCSGSRQDGTLILLLQRISRVQCVSESSLSDSIRMVLSWWCVAFQGVFWDTEPIDFSENYNGTQYLHQDPTVSLISIISRFFHQEPCNVSLEISENHSVMK